MPVALIGTVDMAKKFHPIVSMVKKREKAYAFMFSTIVCNLELLFYLAKLMSPIHCWVIILAQLCSLLVDRIVNDNKPWKAEALSFFKKKCLIYEIF